MDPAIWQRVQAILQRNGLTGGALVRNKFGALLKGIIRCVPCGCAMTPSHTNRNGNKRYFYYVCCGAQKRGWATCPRKSIPAGEIERFVVDQIKCIGKDPALLHATLAEARHQSEASVGALEAERRGLERDLGRWNAEVGQLASEPGGHAVCGRLADLHERLAGAQRRLTEINEQVTALRSTLVNEMEVKQALAAFDPIWEALTPRERVRLVQLVVERVDYDGAAGKIKLTFHPTGLKALAGEMADKSQERSA